jgi:hypothetical protein
LDRLFNEDVPAATDRQAEWWSAFDIGNIVNLNGGAPAPTPVTPLEDDDFNFGSDDDNTDSAD